MSKIFKGFLSAPASSLTSDMASSAESGLVCTLVMWSRNSDWAIAVGGAGRVRAGKILAGSSIELRVMSPYKRFFSCAKFAGRGEEFMKALDDD